MTGGTSGIGLGVAKMLLSKGIKVYGLAYSDYSAPFDYFKCDVTDTEKINKILH